MYISVAMHSRLCYAKTLESYDYDYSSDRAIWAISLVHYWCTHAFQVANCNGFSFNASPMGLEPNGSLYLLMILYDPRTETYVNNNASICLQQDIDVQILCLLFSLMSTVQPNLHYSHNCCFPARVHHF